MPILLQKKQITHGIILHTIAMHCLYISSALGIVEIDAIQSIRQNKLIGAWSILFSFSGKNWSILHTSLFKVIRVGKPVAHGAQGDQCPGVRFEIKSLGRGININFKTKVVYKNITRTTHINETIWITTTKTTTTTTTVTTTTEGMENIEKYNPTPRNRLFFRSVRPQVHPSVRLQISVSDIYINIYFDIYITFTN